MKVTVCFGNVRVIVPCGDGELLVRELIDKSITRYKKAAGKPADHWINVHNLRTCNDGGILDPDDQVNDVADDREQIIAVYEEQGGPPLNHNGGDGASASSVGTGSPESFNSRDQGPDYPSGLQFTQNEDHDVVVTPNDLTENTGLTVHVRRGSEPALNTLPDDTPNYSSSTLPKHTKKASTASPKLTIVKDVEYLSADSSPEGSLKSGIRRMGGKNDLSRFSRDSWRQSLGNRPGMYKWLEAQERQEDKYKTQADEERNEPIGESSTESYSSGRDENSNTISSSGILICMKNEGGPLGIHVVPNVDDNGRTLGLLIQEIEPGRRIFKDGRFRVNDNIIEINDNSIVDTTYKESQEIFRQAMISDEIRLRVVREVETMPSPPKMPPPVLPKPMKNRQLPLKPSPLTLPTGDLNNTDNKENIIDDQNDDHRTATNSATNNQLSVSDSETTKPVPALRNSPNNKNNQPIKTGQPISPAPPSPKKVPPAVPARHPSTTLSKPPAERNLSAPTNTRKIGKKISIHLQKGVSGLGFSITTRDNFAGGNCPIYIKSILPKGAAITHGELKSGDRLLEVNNIHMTGKSQADAVTILRNISMGSIVNLVVSRQEVIADEKFEVPRKLAEPDDAVTPTNHTVLQPSEQSGDLDGTLVEMKHKEFFSFDIPLNDSGSAGLGVSVKGTTLTMDGEESDLGIFIKAVIHGGAASKDGRLLVNDQLMNVNGLGLVDLPNTRAMDMLRRAMVIDGPVPGCINIQVARKADASPTVPNAEHPIGSQSIGQSDSSTQGSTRGDPTDGDQMPSNSEASENSDQTVIMLDKNINNGSNRGVDTKNLILDRYINGDNLRNNAYLKTNMNLNLIDSSHSTDDSLPPPCHAATENGRLSSLTVNPVPVDSVMIENDNYIQQPESRARPHSTIGILRSSPVSHDSSSTEDLRSSSPPPWLKNWDQYGLTEPLSPDENLFSFQREGFGRQSMSEKRRGHLDPRGSEFYQLAKSNRSSDRSSTSAAVPRPLTRSGSTDSLLMAKNPPSVHDPHVIHSKQAPLVPLATLSNSIESLHSSTPDPSVDNEHGPFTNPGVQRNRGCNESFRAAVDRSYDPTPLEAITMDTLEEESSESGSMRIGRSSTNSARSSQSSVSIGEDIYGRKIRRKDKEKKGGIFKGLFRFGKNRKSLDDLHHRMDPAAIHQGDGDGNDQWEKPRVRALQDQERRLGNMVYGSNLESQDHAGQGDGDDRNQQHAGQEDSDRREPWEIAQARKDEQYRLQDQQRKVQEHQMIDHPADRNYTKFPQKYPDDVSSDDGVPPIPQHAPINSRAERVNRLRAEHQRKHQERHGQYPLEEQEERHEQWLREQEIKQYGRPMVSDNEVLLSRQRPLNQPHYDRYSPHPLSTRPSSRLGHSDPINYSHYQNAEEIRQQILQHDHYAEEFRRMQAHHQRQVSDSSSTGNHPASNVYYQQNNVERSRHLSNASSEASNMPVPVNSANISHPMTLQDNSTSLQLSGANNGHFTKSSYTALPVSRNHNDATMNSYHYPDTAPYGYRNQNYIPPPGSARV